MTLNELGQKLSDMYNNAPSGDLVAMIHLFGIKYAKEIDLGGYSKKEIAKNANIPESYGTEISKGVKLAKYVIPK
jgi:5-methylcytosine-specific restriction protein B